MGALLLVIFSAIGLGSYLYAVGKIQEEQRIILEQLERDRERQEIIKRMKDDFNRQAANSSSSSYLSGLPSYQNRARSIGKYSLSPYANKPVIPPTNPNVPNMPSPKALEPVPSPKALEPGTKESCVNVRPSHLREGMWVKTNADGAGLLQIHGGWVKGRVGSKDSSGSMYLNEGVFEDGSNMSTWYLQVGEYRNEQSAWIEILDEDGNEFTGKSAGVTMDSVIISQEKKDQIMEAIGQVEHQATIFTEWGFGETFEKGMAVSLLFYGTPGTGKTLMGQAIADHLKLKLKIIQSGEIWSSEPGQAERNIKLFFENAKKQKQLLLFDECDSLIADRNEVGMILGAQINALLTALERYDGVVVFTTNRLGHMDQAFERRVSAKIEFPFPDADQRLGIWKRLIPEKAPIDKNVDFAEMAKFPMAGGNIKNAVLNAARTAAYEKSKTITHAHFLKAVESEMASLKNFEAALSSHHSQPRAVRGMEQSSTGSLEVPKASIREEEELRDQTVEIMTSKFEKVLGEDVTEEKE